MAVRAGAKPARTRVFYLDLVRAIAAILIVVTHFNNPYLKDGARYVFAFEPLGIYIGDLGVSLFLIISGAALMMVYKDPIDLKVFYWKRIKSIYPMFWIAWILATLYFFLDNHGHPANSAPAESFVYTLLGVDGYVANFDVSTMYILGEWFLGFILVFYLVFPLLRWAVVGHPIVMAVLVLALYAATILSIDGFTSAPKGIILTTRLPELAFGMFFIRYVRHLHAVAIVPCLAVLAYFGFAPWKEQGLDASVATTFVGISTFLVLVVVARYVAIQPVREVVALVAKYSYPIFLVHNVVIKKLFASMDTSSFPPLKVHMLFAATCIIVFALSVGLQKLTDNVVAFITRAFSGMTLRPGGERSTPAG